LAHLSSELSRVLAADGRVDLALLFGSQSRGTATSASDVDVAVRAPFVALDELAATLSAALGMEVDVVSLDEVNIPLKEALIRDSVVVFERQRGLAATWRTHTLIELEVDGPWYRRMRDAWLAKVAEEGLYRAGQNRGG
jgi:predicted nucleotidyltransferase